MVDWRGTPLAVRVSGANRYGLMLFEDLLDAVPPVAGLRVCLRQRPDKAYWRTHAPPARPPGAIRIARRGIKSGKSN